MVNIKRRKSDYILVTLIAVALACLVFTATTVAFQSQQSPHDPIELEHRITKLEEQVDMNNKLIWGALFGIGGMLINHIGQLITASRNRKEKP